MRSLVEALCSDECAGRAAGSPGGRLARAHVVEALRGGGLDPFEQAVPGCDGANVLATLPGDIDRWVVVAAHYDHLGRRGADIYRGADDNAAAVAVLVETARALAARRSGGRGVIVAAFDAEEPPHFGTAGMGSEQFVRTPIVPLDRIDFMVCMDLIGHAVGPAGAPDAVASSLFLLGAERSAGTSARVDALVEPGLSVRRMDAEVIPPLSDHGPFWDREVPFALLTCGRTHRYHTPEDTPAHLAWDKLGATARWLTRFVEDARVRPDERVQFVRDARDDRSTLETVAGLCRALAEVSPLAEAGLSMAQGLASACDAQGRLPGERRGEAGRLVEFIEQGLA